jgi:nicotinate phosphoribosyltransferase
MPANSELALLTDLYQLTMAYGYWRQKTSEQRASFHLYFRSLPFDGGYAVAAGLELALKFIEEFRISESDISYLRTLTGNDSQPLFSSDFLDYLADLQLSCDVHALPEGTLVFPNEPILRIEGPILQCQLLETALLNLINFSTLIATKAARICAVAGQDPVLEFGLRRAQGPDGGVTASRAAYVGGCSATSNVLAGKMYGIPVKGTHAHSWVMSFDDERTAFEQYAEAMPNNCVFLVDTYDTLEGVHKACLVGKKLRENGHEMVGIRLDSGDLAYLSVEARRILDEAGFANAAIIASNSLDETIIESLKQQGAQISVWGVGTKLSTAYDQPALGGVYKLGAMLDSHGTWLPKMKLSEQPVKSSIPGRLQTRRFFDRHGQPIADMIFDLDTPDISSQIVDANHPLRSRELADADSFADLLKPFVLNGRMNLPIDSLDEIRNRVKDQLSVFNPSHQRLIHPHEYPVGIESKLSLRRMRYAEDQRKALQATRTDKPERDATGLEESE